MSVHPLFYKKFIYLNMKALKNISNFVLDSIIFAGIYVLGGIIIVPFILAGAIAACYIVSLFMDKV